MADSIIFTDDPITNEDWDCILGLKLLSGLTKLVNLLHSNGNEAIPVGSLPDYFTNSHVAQLNGVFSKLKLSYRLANAGNRPWVAVLPYEKRALKLYRVKHREKKMVVVKPKGPPQCPPIYFNPNWNVSEKDTDGRVRLIFKGTKDESVPWRAAEMEIKAGLSVGLAGRGFIHLMPTRQEMDRIIGHLQEMRDLIPEE